MIENAQKDPPAANLVEILGYCCFATACPVNVGNDVIGAVGIDGAPGGLLVEQCAIAELDKQKDLLR